MELKPGPTIAGEISFRVISSAVDDPPYKSALRKALWNAHRLRMEARSTKDYEASMMYAMMYGKLNEIWDLYYPQELWYAKR